MDVIGAGFGRTGTLSLKYALERLGFGPCYHMAEIVERPERAEAWLAAARGRADWGRLLAGYRSIVDWPGCYFWRELLDRHPNAKVVLSVRDPRRWYESAAQTIFDTPPAKEVVPRYRPLLELAEEIVHQRTFGNRVDDPEAAIRVYEEHNAAVRAAVPPERLLVFEVGQGWERLCGFLGVEVPDEPFPQTNDRASFHRMFAARWQERG
ncbi:hypothetical protein SAMN02745673_00294 [Marinactinospora thermotolerans DSM 45154]|uniref:Sulfotransferase family protein n=2 Tax=Marinactinospora thermotolerans TaxID=531310 RepID=A0A1T4KBT5_9ACTN|nr:hypothetical protein SAMN02745673_00294 [Marinactinospora thermotolerans DSM 45154]